VFVLGDKRPVETKTLKPKKSMANGSGVVGEQAAEAANASDK
jgi:hypothetical protein